MFLESIAVSNWRATESLNLQLDPGLNLLHGPNESGKSSLFEALRAAFLSRSKGAGSPTSARPWGRGGTTTIDVHFRHNQETWQRRRVFFGNGSWLVRGDAVLAKDDEVLKWLQANLADRGLAALLSVQGEIKLADVPAEMKPHLVATETVTPGVAWLESQLRQEYENYYTAGRGSIKKSLADPRAAVIEAERKLAEVEADMKTAQTQGREMLSLQGECDELRQQRVEQQSRLDQMRPGLAAWETYRRQLAEMKQLQEQEKALTAWLKRWEEQWQRRLTLQPLLADFQSRRSLLESQLTAPPQRSEIERLRDRSGRLEATRQTQFQARLTALKAPAPAQVRELEALEARLQGVALEAELEALQSLQAQLDGQSLSLGAGQTHQWTTASGFVLDLPGARLRVRAGGAEAQRLSELLAELGLASAQEARERLEAANRLQTQIKKGVFGEPLAETLTLEEIEDELAALPGRVAAAEADWKERNEKHGALQKELNSLLASNPEAQLQACEDNLKALRDERQVENAEPIRLQQKELAERIAGSRLEPPAGEEISAASLEAAEGELKGLSLELERLEARRNELVGAAKDRKHLYGRYCEAVEQLARLNDELHRVESRAQAADALWKAFGTARQSLEKDIVQPLRERLRRRLQLLTDKRYLDVQVGADFKASDLLTPDAHLAPLSDLSFGTREQMAFLSRLCLAEMLSEKERNVVVFDDSLVHTDERRCKLTCELLMQAASTCQILLFTCHPDRFVPHLPQARVHEFQSR